MREQEDEDEEEEQVDEEAAEEEALNKDPAVETEDEERQTARFDISSLRKKSNNIHDFLFFRPRRLSELNIVEKVKPIPPYSSLFLFDHRTK